MKKVTFLFLILSSVGLGFAEKVAEYTHIFYPKHLLVTGELIYITDYPFVHIHSAEDFSHLKEIGGEGQGPEEFFIDRESMNEKLLGLEIFVNKEDLFINSMGRLTIFSRQGELKETKPLSFSGGGSRFQPLSGGYLGFSRGRDEKTQELSVHLNIYDKDLKKNREIYKAPFWIRKPRANYDFFERAADSLIVRVYDGKIFIVKAGGSEFEIELLDESGNNLDTIRRDFEKVKLDKNFIKRVHDHYRIKFRRGLEANLRMTTFPEYFPPIRDFAVDENRIYVITYSRRRNGDNEVVIMDQEGNLIETAWLPIREINPEHLYPYAVFGDFLYQLREDENMEKWELHRWRLKGLDAEGSIKRQPSSRRKYDRLSRMCFLTR